MANAVATKDEKKADDFDQVVDQLKSEHGGNLHLVGDEPDQVVVKVPPAVEWDRFNAMIVDEDRKAKAIPMLTRNCVVWAPGAASTSRKDVLVAYDAIMAAKPGLAQTYGNQLVKLAGLAREATVKKL